MAEPANITAEKEQSESEKKDQRQKAVIRYAGGALIQAYLNPGDERALWMSETDLIRLEKTDGERIQVNPSEIKAIFFVKSFQGSPDYSEFKVFTSRPNGTGVWVRVHFRDGEIMEGIAPNSLETYSRPIFHMTPPDPASNNQAVLVSKRFLKDMQVLGLASE